MGVCANKNPRSPRSSTILLVVWMALCIVGRLPAAPEAPAPQSPSQADENSTANGTAPRVFHIRRVNGPPTLESESISTAWLAQATRLEGFTQSSPKEGAPATEKTLVYIGYDAKNLYVIFYCYDQDPAQIRANYSKRDDIYGDDYVGIILDTFNDGRRAYKFLTNPLGVQADSLITEEAGEDLSFDAVFQTRARLTRFGYMALIEIPFRSLRFARQSPRTWGVNLVRSIKRKNEELYWSPVYRDRRGFVNQAGKMTGLENIARGRDYELVPYVFVARTTTLDESHAPLRFTTQSTAKVGTDIKYGITPSLTANVTINPDFNDLEADQPKLRVNRRFKDSSETFVPEKRPFFLERADLFATPINVFFTRKIIEPRFGAKLTGKIGPYSLGFLSARDAAPERGFEDDTVLFRTRQQHATVNALRVRRDLFEQSSVGLIAIDREWGTSFNRLYGVDANFRFLEKYELTMQHIRSFSHAPAENDERATLEKSQGAGSMLTVARSSRHLSMDAYYLNLTPGFRADLGFIERSDVNQAGGTIRYDFWPEGETLVNWGPKLSYIRNYDHKGTLNDVDWDLGVDFELAGSTSIGVKVAHKMERFADTKYIKHPVSFSFSTERAEKISGGLSYSFGPEINYRKNDAFLGRGRELTLDLTLRPSEHFKIQNIFLASHLQNRELPGRPRGFDAYIFQSRLNYQFNREFSIRLIPEFEFLRNRNLLSDDGLFRINDRTRQLRGSLLFSYVLRPGTVLYAGYDSVFQDLDFRARRRFRPGDRGYFIKLSYLYR